MPAHLKAMTAYAEWKGAKLAGHAPVCTYASA